MKPKSEKKAAGILARKLAYRCVRVTSIEKIHEGKEVCTKTGDFSDAKVVPPPFGEIPWNEVQWISDPEGNHGFLVPPDCEEAEIDPFIETIFWEAESAKPRKT